MANAGRNRGVPSAATPASSKNQNVRKTAENLPRTGIEYPIMKLPNNFIAEHPDMEPLSES